MELKNDFEVDLPLEQAWKVLTDVEQIAPCLPGAELQEMDGDEYKGIVKVKVGPVTAQYKGAAKFLELDEAAGRAVLKAEGRETRGQGNASATITAELASQDGGKTRVTVTTDLTITGRVAQFGRGVLADVSSKLLDQFVFCLETTVLSGKEPAHSGAGKTTAIPGDAESGNGSSAGASGSAPSDVHVGSFTPSAVPSRGTTEPVDLMQLAGPSVMKRLAAALAASGLIAVVVMWVRHRLRRG